MNTIQAGILFPQELLESRFFVILATIVALNTVVYAGLAVSKVLPKVICASMFRRAKRRAINRSIYPGAGADSGDGVGNSVSTASRKSTGWPKNQP